MKGTFSMPFSKKYWSLSASELKSLKMIIVTAIFIALRIIVKAVKIPVGDNLNVFFTFAVNALGSFIYGPVLAFISGIACDILSWSIKPSGPFNPAFTLIEALGSFIFALVLYRTKISAFRLLISKFLVSLICNIILTPYFLAVMYGKGIIAIIIPRIFKNLILLPIETAILIIVFSAMLPIIKHMKLLPWLDRAKLTIF